MGCLGEVKGFEDVGIEGLELVGFVRRVGEEDLQRSAMYGAVLIPAKVGVFEGMLVRDVNAAIGDEGRESMR